MDAPPAPGLPPRPPFDWRGVLVSIGITAAAGWAMAGTPFRGDQALFTVYAERLAHGEVLYRDAWDVTNPGVFWFYRLAGTAFGFTEDGVHLFEWLYWLAFVQAASFAAWRGQRLDRWPLAPAVLVGGVYFLTSSSDPSHLTKAEGLAAFPLLASVWLACAAAERPRPSLPLLLAAGVTGGAVLLFKFAFAPCLLAGWLPPLVAAVRRRGESVPRVFVRFGLIAVGAAGVLGVAAGHFALNGALADAADALFVQPGRIVAHAEMPGVGRLAGSVRWFVEVYSPVLAAAVLGACASLTKRVDPLTVALGLVVAAAVVVVLVQRWSWWSYHLLLPGVPAAALAAYTWPALKRVVGERLARPFSRTERAAVATSAVALFLPVLGHGANAYLRLAGHHGGLTGEDRRAARAEAGRAYRVAADETAWLADPSAEPGPIFVAGDPCFHLLSGRAMATPMHGWSLELFTPELWDRLLAQLRAARPVYVFVETGEQRYDRLIRERAPELTAWLAANYEEVRKSDNGVWLRSRSE